MVTAQARDEADAELRLAQAELKAAQENRDLAHIEYQSATEQLAMRSLVSPFDGVVIDRMLNPGDLAEAGTGRKRCSRLRRSTRCELTSCCPGHILARSRRVLG